MICTCTDIGVIGWPSQQTTRI